MNVRGHSKPWDLPLGHWIVLQMCELELVGLTKHQTYTRLNKKSRLVIVWDVMSLLGRELCKRLSCSCKLIFLPKQFLQMPQHLLSNSRWVALCSPFKNIFQHSVSFVSIILSMFHPVPGLLVIKLCFFFEDLHFQYNVTLQWKLQDWCVCWGASF